MKKFFTHILMGVLMMLTVSLNAQDLFISEVADPGDEYKGRFVEIFNPTVSDVDLSAGNYYIVRQANGGSTADIQLTGTIEAGTAYVVATNATDFESFYGFAPDMANGSVTGSGDDGYFLFIGGGYSTGTLLDIYGVIDEDGTDKPWEYLDSRASRVFGINTPNTTWTASEWEIVSANVADMDPGVHAPVQDLFAPEWANGYPKAINIIETGFDIAVSLDETSTVYYVIMAAGGTEPTVEEVKAGTGPSGATAVAAGTITAGTSEATETITDLTTDQEYSVYLVAEDDEDTPNTQAAVTTFNVTPVIPPSVLYLADFETSIDPFTQFSEVGDKVWTQKSGYMEMNGYGSETAELDWLITPEIDLTNVTEAQLLFDANRYYGLYDETHSLKLYYSEDYDGNTANIGIATWVEIPFDYPTYGDWEEIGPLDISSLTGTAYFAFVYDYAVPVGNDFARWRIDDAQILGYSPETAVATLDELNIDDVLVEGFDAAKTSYIVELPAGTSTVPAVTWTLTNENATAVLTDATDLSGDEAARTTTVEVTSQDETVVTEYTILFNPILEVANLGELRAATDDTRKYTVTGEVILTQKDSYMNKKYFEDATGAIEIYDPNPAVITTIYEIGDGVTGLTGTLNEYFGMLELEPTEDPGTASSTGNTVEPQLVTVSDFVTNHEDYEAEFVKIEGVTFADAGGTFDDLNNYVVSVGEDQTVFRTHFTGILSSAIPTMADIQGIAVWHYDEAKVAPRMASDLMAYSADATLTDLAVDGTTVTGFDAATLDYAVELPMGTTVVPTVTYALSDDNAEVDQTDATNLTGTEAERTTSVVVTSQDGTTENAYTIVFTVSDVSVELNNISKLTVYPVPTANQLFVEGLENSENIKIVDIAGKVLLSEQATGDKMVFDVGGLEGGIYMIITETSVHKFVKK